MFSTLQTSKSLTTVMATCFVVVATSLYWHGAQTYLLQQNADMGMVDQSAYMAITQTIYDRLHGTAFVIDAQQRTENFPYTHDGARLWLYPFLQLQSFHPGMSQEDVFREGKYFNVKLSLCLLYTPCFNASCLRVSLCRATT